MENKKRIAITFIVFTLFFTLFRSSMSGIFSLYYSNFGVIDNNISLIKSFQNIGILLGLLPAGYLADKIGRVKIIIISSVVIASSFCIILFSNDLIGFSLAEFLYGIGLAMNSGVVLAYTNDLENHYNIRLEKKVMGRRTALQNIATLVGGNIGTSLFQIDNQFPLYFSIMGLLCYPLFIYGWIKYNDFSNLNPRIHKKRKPKSIDISFLLKKNVLYAIFISLCFEGATQFVLVYWSIFYVNRLNFNLSTVFTLSMISVVLGSEIYSQLTKSIKSNNRILIGTLYILSFSLFGMGILENRWLSIVLFALVEVCIGIVSSSILTLESEIITYEEKKSSILATISFVTEIGVISILLINKILMRSLSLQNMFLVSSAFIAVGLLLIYINHLKGKKRKEMI
ncbi:MFS transporter [Enterococcus mundtii]|uniref:MFS transporter n=1 Tax=Enterococcus mundtii TaxID=53346 RepID=UPI002952E3A2|nr:MFS transporter [Enterococcus mundtii]MDV7743613.1 MFS transporter [Enterococcus mundtii]